MLVLDLLYKYDSVDWYNATLCVTNVEKQSEILGKIFLVFLIRSQENYYYYYEVFFHYCAITQYKISRNVA